MPKNNKGKTGGSMTFLSKLNRNKLCLIQKCQGINENNGYCLNHYPK